ncbi:MFS transporter [Cohaesibacter gelatinilyticus]|uniref:Predicted arabinose efflux permease, MFS family n=1 Tax=Cohaesibacter gelatinilyticus TaxID=372072 RepID=A0A285PF79_9HYPH|nr:MFS transporter [Cohaesibacter gelatinilyticus]SNZ20390.1 Predicted arabinose efflux permease, MFS family [Cohaesibacter gelatinilyticus]
MVQAVAPVASLLFSVVLLLIGHGLQSTIIPLASKVMEFPDLSIGLAASAYFAGFVMGGIISPHLVVRAGHIRGFAVMVSSMSAAALLHPLLADQYAWILFRFTTGFCVAGLYLIIESWLNEFADNTNRGLIMSIYIVVNYAAFTTGQLLATLSDPENFFLFAIASIIISVAVMPVAMTKAAQPAPIAVVKLELFKVFRTAPAAIVAALLVGSVQGSHISFAAIYAVDKGYETLSQAPVFAAVFVIGGMIGQWPIGRISDRFDRRIVLLIISIFGILGSLLISSFDKAPFMLLLLMGGFIGAMVQPAYSLAAAHGYDHAETEGYVKMAAGLLVAFGIGSTLGPFITSIMMSYFGPDALFLFPAVMLALLCLYLVQRIVRKDAIQIEDKEGFDLAATSAAVGGIVTPELLSEEDKYVVVPNEWEAEPQDEEVQEEGKLDEEPESTSNIVNPEE